MPDDVQESAPGGEDLFMSASGQHTLHEFSQGRPYGYLFQTVSSEAAPPAERYDYWTGSLVRGLQVDRPNEPQARDFRATATSLASHSGEMHLVRTDGFTGTRAPGHIRADQSDEMALHLIVEGKLTGQYDGDGAIVAEAGDFFLFDGVRPLRLAIEGRSSIIQIDLSRSLMESIFSGRPPSPSSVAKALAASSLTPLLRAHLLQFSRAMSGMNAAEQLAMLDASEAFVIATIEGAFAGAAVPGATGNEGLLMAAQRYIRAHLGRHDLNPSEIAAAVGCSRATLYRLFQGHGMTVSGHIRELRLQRLMRLLQRTSDGALVTVLAYRCGFHDIPNLNQMFRRRFGVSPTQARAMSPRQ